LGIFASVPVTAAAISELGWADALLGLAGLAGAICFLSIGLSRTPGAEADATREQSLVQALVEAGSHRGYVLLVLGFFVCGFQLAFIGTHLPAYLADRAMAPSVGGMALAVVGAANVVGTLACGLLGDRTSKKNLLAVLYLVRAGATVLFLYAPLSVASVLLYAAIMGLTWLGTVPLTSAIVAQVFGPRYMATLVGVVFLMHQVGSFLGAWLGGYFFDRMGSYDPVWWTVAALGVVAAVLHWPIDERPLAVGRRAAA
jgi:predicted MFS family arabinose efflux permease